MIIKIILSCADVECDRQTITTTSFNGADDDSAEISKTIHDALDAWTLAPGNTILIIES
jgi:hypothetical protein